MRARTAARRQESTAPLPHPAWTVRRWVRAHRAGGEDALSGTPHPGRKPFLTPEQEVETLGWLAQKPTAFGFRTDLWTAARVAHLIHKRFGVGYDLPNGKWTGS